MAKYILISNHLRDSIARFLERYAEEHSISDRLWHYPKTVRKAPTIELPEMHIFTEADGNQFMICAFNQGEAEERANREPWRKKPLTWVGQFVVWPGMGSVNLALHPDEDEPPYSRIEEEKDEAPARPGLGETQPIHDYLAAARVIALHLNHFCDKSLPYSDMIAEASRKAARYIKELEDKIAASKIPF